MGRLVWKWTGIEVVSYRYLRLARIMGSRIHTPVDFLPVLCFSTMKIQHLVDLLSYYFYNF